MASVLANMGLVSWPSPEDKFNSAQLALNMQRIDNHDHSPGKGKPLTGASLLDGAVGAGKLDAALGALLGITQGASVRRAKSIVATEETRTNTAFGTFTTPDTLSVTLPTDGLIMVVAQADVKESVGAAASFSLYLDTTTLGALTGLNSSVTAGTYGGVATDWSANVSPLRFLTSPPGSSAIVVCQPVIVTATAGSHSISLQTKSTSGSVSAKNRKIWAWTVGF